MNSKTSVALVSTSALAAGIAQGAVTYSGQLNLQQNWDAVGSNYRQPVDMNGDGVGDFTFGYDANSTKPYVDVRPTYGSGLVSILGKANHGFPVTTAGTMIDDAYATTFPVISFQRGYMANDDQNTPGIGDWSTTSVTDAYVGIELSLAGGTSYGWLHFIDNPTTATPSLTLVDWAYETTPGVGIQTATVPEPSACALGAVGLAGLLLWRKRQNATGTV